MEFFGSADPCSTTAVTHGPRTSISPIASPSQGSTASASTMRRSTPCRTRPVLVRQSMSSSSLERKRGGGATARQAGRSRSCPRFARAERRRVLDALDQTARHGRSAADDQAEGRQIDRMRFGMADEVVPDRRHPARERRLLSAINRASGSACANRPGKIRSDPPTSRRAGCPRRWRETSTESPGAIALRQPERRGRNDRHRMQVDRAMAVDDAFGIARRAARVAHRRRRVLVRFGIVEPGLLGGEELVVAVDRAPSGDQWETSPSPTTTQASTVLSLRRDRSDHREQRRVHEDDAVAGVVGDVHELLV